MRPRGPTGVVLRASAAPPTPEWLPGPAGSPLPGCCRTVAGSWRARGGGRGAHPWGGGGGGRGATTGWARGCLDVDTLQMLCYSQARMNAIVMQILVLGDSADFQSDSTDWSICEISS